jgi:hypothetical protein
MHYERFEMGGTCARKVFGRRESVLCLVLSTDWIYFDYCCVVRGEVEKMVVT